MFLLHYSRTGRCWWFPCTRWSYKTWKNVRRKLESFDVTSLPNFKSLCLSRLDITPEGKCLCPQLPETLGAVVEVDFFCWMWLAGNLYGPKIETIQGSKDPHEYSSRIYPLCWQYLTQDIWEVHRLYEVSPFTWQLPSDDCWFLCFPSLSISTSMDVGYLISLLLKKLPIHHQIFAGNGCGFHFFNRDRIIWSHHSFGWCETDSCPIQNFRGTGMRHGIVFDACLIFASYYRYISPSTSTW